MIENSSTKSFTKTDDDTGSGKALNIIDLPGFDRLRVSGLEVNLFF